MVSFLLTGSAFIFIVSCGDNTKNPTDSSGNDTYDRLIINEVHFVSIDNNENWIEVNNPADTTFTLISMGMSNVWTMNILPSDIKKIGGLKMAPGEFLMICADSTNNPDVSCPSIQVSSLSKLYIDGGYVRISTQVGEEESLMVFVMATGIIPKNTRNYAVIL
jgi:hypothetical protein